MLRDTEMAMIRETSNLSLEFCAFRGISQPDATHPNVAQLAPSGAVVEIRLRDDFHHAIQVEFSFKSEAEPQPEALNYQYGDLCETYRICEFSNSEMPSWFIRSDFDAEILANLSDAQRLQLLQHFHQAGVPAQA